MDAVNRLSFHLWLNSYSFVRKRSSYCRNYSVVKRKLFETHTKLSPLRMWQAFFRAESRGTQERSKDTGVSSGVWCSKQVTQAEVTERCCALILIKLTAHLVLLRRLFRGHLEDSWVAIDSVKHYRNDMLRRGPHSSAQALL